MSTYLHQQTHPYLLKSTYIPHLPTSTHLPTYINMHIPTNIKYLPSNINTPTYLYQHTFLPMSTYKHIPTHVNHLYQSLNINTVPSQINHNLHFSSLWLNNSIKSYPNLTFFFKKYLQTFRILNVNFVLLYNFANMRGIQYR